MADARISGLVAEVSRAGVPDARVSGLVAEISRTGVPTARVSGLVLEVSRTVVYEDNFTGTPGTTVQSQPASSGQTYTKHPNSTVDAVIADEGGARVADAGGEAIYLTDYVPQQTDYAVTYDVKVKTKPAGLQVGPVGRGDTSANTFIWGGYDADTDTWRIVQRVAGVETVIGTPIAANLELGTVYEVSLEFDPDTSTVYLYVDGRLKVSGTVTVTDIGKLGFKIKQPGGGGNNAGGNVNHGKGPDKVNKRPIADFSYLIQGNTVTFTNASNDPDGSISGYSWDFGDGDTSTEESPIHIYQDKGKFNVTLTVTDNLASTEIATDTVSIGGGGRRRGREMWVTRKKKK